MPQIAFFRAFRDSSAIPTLGMSRCAHRLRDCIARKVAAASPFEQIGEEASRIAATARLIHTFLTISLRDCPIISERDV
jgi:hypothetical protein